MDVDVSIKKDKKLRLPRRAGEDDGHFSVAKKKKKSVLKKTKTSDIHLPTYCTSKSLAALLNTRAVDIVKILIKLNSCPNSSEEYLDNTLVDIICEEYERNPVRGTLFDKDRFPRPEPEDPSIYPRRAPIVALMGHVDHGKTTLLDALRKSNITKTEVGGITQRISSFSTPVTKDHSITFIDTPGHAAFARMRKRGAHITDIAVLVVAADEGVQEQTHQTIRYIQEVECPFVVAISKCDKPNANPDKVRTQLSSMGIVFARYGGDIHDVEISSLKGDGLEELKETLLLVAEEHEITADRAGYAEADILDVKKQDHRGLITSCIISVGTLKKGDYFVAGLGWGKVKGLFSFDGKPIKEALPGMPIDVSGWEIEPIPGDQLLVVKNEKEAKNIADLRRADNEKKVNDYAYLVKQREQFKMIELEQKDRMQAVMLGLDPDVFVSKQLKVRESLKLKEVTVVIKADGAGSIEAIEDAVSQIPQDEVYLRIIRTSVGTVSEDDVNQASMIEPHCHILGFNVKPTPKVKRLAQDKGVTIQCFDIIYSLVDWIKDRMSKQLSMAEESVILAQARVLQIFSIRLKGIKVNIAGCHIEKGTFKRGLARVVRDGEVIHEGPIRSLRHEKNDVKEIGLGKECGISFGKDFDEFEENDVIQVVEIRYVPRKIGEKRRREFNPFIVEEEDQGIVSL